MDRYPDLFMDHDCQAIFEQIDFHPEDGIVFFASGVFYYFKKTDVEKLFTAMAEHFTGGKLIFDATKKKGLKSMLKTWLNGFITNMVFRHLDRSKMCQIIELEFD